MQSTAVARIVQDIAEAKEHDARFVDMWVHGRPAHTQRAYRHDIAALHSFTGKCIIALTLADLQAFADSLEGADTTKGRALKSVKSFLTFLHKAGLIPVNVGAALQLPKIKNTLAQRILSEEAVIRLISLEPDQRNHAILRLMYHCGLRVSEVVSLHWRDVTPRNDGAQLTVFGKGGKTPQVLISTSMYEELRALSPGANPDELLFRSQKGGGQLGTRHVERIVKDAATRAGIKGNVSPHWLRHSHASHSLDRGAPIHLVQETLGHANLATTGRYTHPRPQASSSQFLAL
jgi:integrase/recombinase XerD